MGLKRGLLPLLIPLTFFAGGPQTQSTPPPNPDVALAPFAVVKDSGGTLRSVADACLERLAAGLAAKGIGVVRRPSLDEKTLSRGRPARWAVLGQLSRDKGQIRAELRLMEISSGDEMRSYFNDSADPQAIVALGGGAADRIALFVQEKRQPGSSR